MNRTQRVRRSRLATLALSLVAVLAVSSLPAAAPARAASGDRVFITPATVNAGPAGSTFSVTVSTNSVTPLGGVQASVAFDNSKLQLLSVSRPAGFWGSAPIQAQGNTVAEANAEGKLRTVAAAYITTGGSATGTTIPFLTLEFRVTACPANGQAGSLDLPIGPADVALTAADGSDVEPLPADVTGATIACTPPAAFDFTMSASPATVTVAQGGTASTTITTTLTSGTPELVTLGVDPVAGVTATFGSSTVTPTASTSLTFAVSAAAATGTYPLVVTGEADSRSSSVNITLLITPPPAGPPPASGTTTVTGTVDAGFLGVSVDPFTELRLRRNAPNETTIPVLVFSNTQWTLSIEDAMLAGKAEANRGHMLDSSATPAKRLSRAMQAYVPVPEPAVPLVRTLDVVGPQSLASGQLNQTVGVTISQLTVPADPPGNYAIDLQFSAISGF